MIENDDYLSHITPWEGFSHTNVASAMREVGVMSNDTDCYFSP